ncbi:MAG: AAA family ATPase [Clostridia bacterium]|nr:AAA family ATPase [Clostridia bacterium]
MSPDVSKIEQNKSVPECFKFSEDFGITEQEMQETIKHFGIEEDEENLKKWYDGYRIGNTENIYNPWSVLNYLAKNELKPKKCYNSRLCFR